MPVCFAGLFWLLAFLCCPAQAATALGNPGARPGNPSPATHEILVERDVPIPMRDGAVMRADIYRPKTEGRFPVLVESSAYERGNSTDIRMGTHTFFVPRGYVFIIRNTRGRYTSEGEFDLCKWERNDGYDTVEWAAAQPWSNGRVGLVGKSYAGQFLLHTAAANPPHLVCAMSALTASDVWREWYYRGGAMEFAFTTHWAGSTFARDLAEKHLSPEAFRKWDDLHAVYLAEQERYASVVPPVLFQPARIGDSINLFRDWTARPEDGEHWQRMSPWRGFPEITIPILHIGGWYDIFLNGTLKTYQGITEKGGSEKARRNQRLFIGPWHHRVLSWTQSRIGVLDFGPGFRERTLNQARLAFADYWLKDIKHEAFDPGRPVQFFTMGANEWRASETWPLPGVAETRFYLRDGRSGTIDSLNDGVLSPEKPQLPAEPHSYVYDPMDPTPTRGGSILYTFTYSPHGLSTHGPQDQTPVDRRSLTFTSDIVQTPLEITGAVRATLHAASSAVDTDWVVRLSDVHPDGTPVVLAEGIQRARYRDSDIRPTLLDPGRIYAYTVDLWSTSHVFQKGHRIRVTIASSNFPRWSRNMNVAEFPEQATGWVKAVNSVYLDPDHPSHIVLPVRENGGGTRATR